MPNPLPNGKQQFVDGNGKPLAGGSVTHYVPSTTTPSTTWQDSAGTIPNANPLTLDAYGEAVIWGSGTYRQIVKDAAGNTIWDQNTSTVNVSAAMQPVLAASTVAAALALLGGASSTSVASQIATVTALTAPALTNITALRAATTATLTQARCAVLGYNTIGDGGFGGFVLVSSDTTSPDNGGTIIVDASSRRWYRDVGISTKTNLCWFGGSTASADNTGALVAALGALKAPGGTVFIPAGKYTFTSAITYTVPTGPFSVGLEGAGADATILYWPTTAGIAINGSNARHAVHVRDLTLSTGTSSAGNAIALTNTVQGGNFAQNDFTRVTIRGDDGGATAQGWTTGINVVGWCNINYDTVLIYGGSAASNGIAVAGDPAGSFKYSIVHNVDKCGFFNLSVGFNYGTYLQGVTISKTNMTNGGTGVWIPSSSFGADQLALTGNQIDCSGNAVLVEAPMTALNMQGNLIYVSSSGAGLGVRSSGFANTITGNTFVGHTLTGTTGISLGGSWEASVITGNAFNNLATAVFLGTGTTGINVQSDAYANNTTNVTDSGTLNTVGGGSI